MEFLRFGSSIPGGYWGCCAVDIIQNFKQDPDEKASISCVNGDGGQPMMDKDGVLFLGPTWRDIFKQRLRINTFNTGDKPNHAFLAVLTDWQISSGYGLQWLKILKEEGFEFLRTTDNSVYSGASVITAPSSTDNCGNRNYLFGLFRNVGTGHVGNPYLPPKAWTDLEQVVPEPWQHLQKKEMSALTEENQAYHLKRWHEIGPVKFLSESELVKQGVPITYAGVRSRYPQQAKAVREQLQAEEQSWKDAYNKANGTSSVVLRNSIFGSDEDVCDEIETEYEGEYED